MTTSRNIAGLLGPTLIAVALSEGLNFPVLLANTTPSVIYLNGTLLFVAGLSIVRAHNRWTIGWPVLVTLTGWVVFFAGLIRMFVPGVAQRGVENATAAWHAGLIIPFALGVFLTFKAYRR